MPIKKKNLTKEDVLNLAEQNNVKFIRLMFMDLTGINKNVEIPVEDLKMSLEGKIMFDGSSIEGFSRIEESDMFLMPDTDTFTIFPWITGERRVARMICDILTPEGEPFQGCPRGILKKVLEEAENLGYTICAGPEAEFFLFQLDDKGRPTVQTHDQGGYFDLSPIDKGEDARKDMVFYLEQMGFKIEASHHEVAPGQHEIDFAYSDALTTADNLATFRMVVRTVARDHGLHATFMPKPLFGINGSGMHTHQSLYKNGNNAFYDPSGNMQLSQVCRYYIGGILKHAREFTAVTNPLVNSYKRLVPGYEAPVYIAWSERNRSPLVRIPAPRGNGTRVELRSPDPACNPYLAFAAMFAAGLEGIKNKIEPPSTVDENIYEMNEAELREKNIGQLPGSLLEAINIMSNSELMKRTLGDHVFYHIINTKRIEWQMYNMDVHNWELVRYLGQY
jgi:glutamine synthetase